jgi:hypothetical protein
MKRVPVWLCLAITSTALVSGCKALAVATTAVKPDGSWTRTVRFRGMNNLDEVKEAFVLPYGAPWKTRKEWVEGEASYTAERRLRQGETLRQDLLVRVKIGHSQQRLMVNEVTVRAVAPGKIEYREALHWQGPRPKPIEDPGRKVLAVLRSALPNGLATDADTRDLVKTVTRELWRAWFGPGSPLFWNGHDDLAARRARRLLGLAIDKALLDRFGERITPAQRLAAARTWVKVILEVSHEDLKVKESSDTSSWNGAAVPLLFSAWLPGKVVATNGERDEVSGEVFWGLYAEAAASEDVVLTATCDLNPVSAKMATRNRQR